MKHKQGRRLLAVLIALVLALGSGGVIVLAGEWEESANFSGWDEEGVFSLEEALPEQAEDFPLAPEDFSQELVEAAQEEESTLFDLVENEASFPAEEGEFFAAEEELFTDADSALVGETLLTPYVDEKGEAKDPVSCTLMDAGWNVIGNGWYAVKGEVRISSGMTVWGNTNLILTDGCTLYADDGIWVQENASLSIWAQSTGKEMGRLEAKASSEYKAGIGGIYDEAPGAIYIYGGKITATGGRHSAGIGAGSEGKRVNVTIAGGDVTANGTSGGPGIGAGSIEINGADITGTVKITGGTVVAKGSTSDALRNTSASTSAGIGAGFACNCNMTIEIEGGNVTARAWGEAAAIGGGAEDWSGQGGEGATVRITGGKVLALSDHTAIGHGTSDEVMGTLFIGPDMKVQAGNNGENYERTFTTVERAAACQYRHCALIEKCDHGETFYKKEEAGHTLNCKWCEYNSGLLPHVIDPVGACSECGYSPEGSGIHYLLSDEVTEETATGW